MSIRFRSRFTHATVVGYVTTNLTALGWVTAPVNFGADPVTILDYAPEDRGDVIKTNTVAISLGDLAADVDEELGATAGGLRSVLYPIFCDVYTDSASTSMALGDDLRDMFDLDITFPLVNQITMAPVEGASLVVEDVSGPERPTAATGPQPYKRNWRIVKVGLRLYYQDA